MKKTPSLKESIEAQKALDTFLAESEEYFQLVSQENPEISLKRIRPDLNDFTHDAAEQEIAFRQDTNIKPAKTALHLSQAHIDEIAFCAYNPIYMAMNYSKIVHQDYGIIPFEMWPYQQKVAKSFFGEKRALLCWPRQAGKTITVAYMLLYYCIFNKMKNVAIVANKRSTAVEILDRIKLVYLNLPMWLKPGVVKWGEGQIVFENGCKIFAAATTSASIRSHSISVLYIDECSFIHKKLWASFAKSTFPVVSSSKLAKIIISTTPNGKDHFYKMWEAAVKKRSSYVPIRVRWWEVPGRDEKWRERTIMDEFSGDVEAFLQEYDTKFSDSSKAYVGTKAFERLSATVVEPLRTFEKESMRIFEEPIPGVTYLMFCDIGHGTGKDSTTAIVFSLESNPLRIVAAFKSNTTHLIDVPHVFVELAKAYNNATVAVENNDMGGAVANDMWYKLNYTYMLNMDIERPDRRYTEIGLRTTGKSKKIGEQYLKFLLENDKLVIRDYRIMEEISNLSYNDKNGAFEAEDVTINDDFYAALRMFAYFLRTQNFSWLTEKKDGTGLENPLMKQREDDEMAKMTASMAAKQLASTTPQPKKRHDDRYESRFKDGIVRF